MGEKVKVTLGKSKKAFESVTRCSLLKTILQMPRITNRLRQTVSLNAPKSERTC